MAKLIITRSDPALTPLRIKIQNRFIKIPDTINLGCINVSNPNVNELITKYLMNLLLSLSIQSLIINPAAIKKPEAVRLSYPIHIEIKDNVGFKIINKKTRYENFLSLVLDSCKAKKYAENEKIAD